MEKINKSVIKFKGKNIAVVGIAVLVVVLLLTGILIARHFAFRITCAKNLSALSAAILKYTNDNGSIPSDKWCDLLTEHCEVELHQFRCKGASEGPCNYAMNENLVADVITSEQSDISDIVVLFETQPGWNQHGGPELFTFNNYESRGGYVLLNDGTVKFIHTGEELNALRWW